MNILPLIIAPDPILQQKSLSIPLVDDKIRRLMDDMLVTMYHEEGAGLAAVQVGILKRILIVDIDADGEKSSPIFMANPEIINLSDEQITRNEGCLSFPEQRLEISRASNIEVKFIDYHNQIQQIKAQGWLATAILHEIDHLNGKVFIDYASKLKKEMMLKRAKKIKKLN